MAFRDLEKLVISDQWIEDYRREHISRAFEVRLKGGLIKPRHPHRNHPYCNICDMDYEGWDVGYRIYVGGHAVVYHKECIEASWDTKKVRNILAQDRGFRRKLRESSEKANELKVRTQLYKYIIGSVLSDASGESPWRSQSSIFTGETPPANPGIEVSAVMAEKNAQHGLVANEL